MIGQNDAVSTYVALFRAVNVGGRNRVPMKELKPLFSSIGLEDATTYIQSGNVVFRAASASGTGFSESIERAIADAYGLDIDVILRTPAQLARIIDRNPFLEAQPDRSKLHVAFMSSKPTGGAGSRLDPKRSSPDEFSVSGAEIYLHFPNGSGRSKLTMDYFERRLEVRATARNWNTVTRLLELASA